VISVLRLKEHIEGKSAATVTKYQKSLELLAGYLEWREAEDWGELSGRDWAELIGSFYFERNFDTSINHAKSFLSVLKKFLKYVDRKYQTSHSEFLKQLLDESEQEIFSCISMLDQFVPYQVRKYGSPFYDAELRLRSGIIGVFQIQSINASSVRVKEIIDKSRKTYTVSLPRDVMENVFLGQLIEGSIRKTNINSWGFETVERVFPSFARHFL